MISLIKNLPQTDKINAELIKIKCLYEAYKNDDKVLFWAQDQTKALISMTDGNMIIFNNGAQIGELREFADMLSPACIFSDYETLAAIGRIPDEKINVMYRVADTEFDFKSETLKSDEIYSLLDVDGLSLPEYPYFAVDYCHRLNIGTADYFALKNKCAAISFSCGDKAILNGIASREKGYGSVALKGILNKNLGRHFLVCCRDKVKGFYEKNGFKFLYFGGYWVKNR